MIMLQYHSKIVMVFFVLYVAQEMTKLIFGSHCRLIRFFGRKILDMI